MDAEPTQEETGRPWGIAEAVLWIAASGVLSIIIFPKQFLLGWLLTSSPGIAGGIVTLIRRALKRHESAALPPEYLRIEHRTASRPAQNPRRD